MTICHLSTHPFKILVTKSMPFLSISNTFFSSILRSKREAHITTSSILSSLNIKHQPRRIRDLVRHTLQKRHTLPSINQPMIVRQRQIHHRPSHHIPLLIHHRPHLCRVHPQYRALGLIDDGRPHKTSKHPTI
mmetsp:Transcript_36729/g.77516  ORF Transcript_36729/g.77516 Transcript_36729/m.77516 type:complete len:133 (+) Transcript_36729:106-504(+)